MTLPGRAAALLLVLAAATAAACTAPRVGVVESRRVLRESVLALTYQRQLDDREKAMAADLRLLSGQLSAEDLEARRQSYLTELTDLKQSLETTLNDRIRDAVQQVAKRRRLGTVLVKESVSIGGIDVTDDVIAQLR